MRIALVLAIAVALVGGGVVYHHFRSNRLTPGLRVEAAQDVRQQLAERPATDPAAREETEVRVAGADTDGGARPERSAPQGDGIVPETFKVEFECSNGTFVAEFNREWAPLGVERVHELVQSGFFEGARFFRVVDGFMVQFGIAGDPEVQAEWVSKPLGVEEVTQSNTRGMISFAMAGRAEPFKTNRTRTTQLFINFGDNKRLDQMGFAPVGKVVEGMDVVDAIHSGYGEGPRQDLIQSQGNRYLEAQFPRLDYIKSARVIGDEAETAAEPEDGPQDDSQPEQ